MKPTLIFDLDFTLYDMGHVLDVALEGVVNELSKNTVHNKSLIKKNLDLLVHQYGRLDDLLFNKLLNNLGLPLDEYLVICISAFHTYFPKKLSLYPGVHAMLLQLQKSHELVLLTDGNVNTQMKKVEILNLNMYFEHIVFSQSLGLSKPEVFEKVIMKYNLVPSNCTMVGDHPYKDIYGAKKNGMTAIRVQCGDFRNLPDINGYHPDYILSQTQEVLNHIQL